VNRLVYSTEHGTLCEGCSRAKSDCVCKQAESNAPTDGVVRVGRETKGRRGGGVTVISGVPLSGEALSTLAKSLKKRCGCGGTLKDGVIEIQGDQRDVIVAELAKYGWTVKRAGG
jgi:translation initiation factor 1